MERAAALRDLKLLAGSGGLDFTKGMDSLDKHVEQSSFRASHFVNMGSSKAGPTSNPLLLKAQSRQFFVDLKQSHARNQQPVIQSLDTTILSFACMMQACCRAGGACCRSQGPQASGREWRLRFHKRHGFLSEACRTNLLQGVTFCEHRQLKGWQPHFQPTVAKSSIS